nr:unnamed protein product [Digitaria exilis]
MAAAAEKPVAVRRAEELEEKEMGGRDASDYAAHAIRVQDLALSLATVEDLADPDRLLTVTRMEHTPYPDSGADHERRLGDALMGEETDSEDSDDDDLFWVDPIKYDLLEKGWGWQRLVPYVHGVDWTMFKGYLEEYYIQNAVYRVKETGLLSELLDCRSNTTEMVKLCKKIRQSAFNLMLYEGPESAAAAGALVGLAKEAKFLCYLLSREDRSVDQDYYCCDAIRMKTVIALDVLLQDCIGETSSGRHVSYALAVVKSEKPKGYGLDK